MAGFQEQGGLSIAIGQEAGNQNQETNAIAIGGNAGHIGQQGYSIAIGTGAGDSYINENSIAIGNNAGHLYLGSGNVAIGYKAGYGDSNTTYINSDCIAIGSQAGYSGQETYSIAIGYNAGKENLRYGAVAIGENSCETQSSYGSVAIGWDSYVNAAGNQSAGIAIGYKANIDSPSGGVPTVIGNDAYAHGMCINSIVLGTGSRVTATTDSGGFFVQPIRYDDNDGGFIDATLQVLWYKPADGGNSREVVASYLQRTGVTIYPILNALGYMTGVYFGVSINNGAEYEGSHFDCKSFVIDHPKDPENKYLVHGCLEGPESGVYYRGTAKVTNNHSTIVSLPDYVPGWASNFTVTVTAIYDGKVKMYATSKVDDSLGQFTVYGENGEFNWIAVGQRATIKVEPLKSETTAKGFGPYKWVE